MFGWDATAVITDSTPSPAAFLYAGTGNVFTSTLVAMLGLKVEVSESGGTLPTGLSASTPYYYFAVPGGFSLATSQANAIAGTAIVITGAGSGTFTITPQALAGTLVAQKSDQARSLVLNEGASVEAFTITTPTTAATQNITATTLNYYDIQAMYCGLQFLATVTSGQATVTIYLNTKGA
jgi:sulfur relay (sulfurtransferase) DsrF/TusC family protein